MSADRPRLKTKGTTARNTAIAAALGIGAAGGVAAATSAARRDPPEGRLIETAAGRLHVVERGPDTARQSGPPILLLHGCATMAEDWLSSPALHLLTAERRVIVADRPGYGHSERRRGADHSAAGQAAALAEAAHALGLGAPVVVGHGHGALVALAYASHAAGPVSGAVLISGAFFRGAGLGRRLAGRPSPALPGVLRHAVSAAAAQAAMPLTLRRLFAPRPVPAAFRAAFSPGLAARPSQLSAAATDLAGAEADAARLVEKGCPPVPLALLAGREDRVADAKAETMRLATTFGIKAVQLVPGAGHMVHHSAPGRTAAMILRFRAGLSPASALTQG